MKHKKVVSFVTIILLGLFLAGSTVQEGSGYSIQSVWTKTYLDYSGTSDAIANAWGGSVPELVSQMRCSFSSEMSPRVNIGRIGFYWAACTVKCRNNATGADRIPWDGEHQKMWNPGVNYNSSYKRVGAYLSNACNPNEYPIMVAEGYHDFANPVWQPETIYYSTQN